jgi:hypothetical protein
MYFGLKKGCADAVKALLDRKLYIFPVQGSQVSVRMPECCALLIVNAIGEMRETIPPLHLPDSP